MQLICPMCKKPVRFYSNKWRPFCSERCKMRDLGEWASGAYRIEGEEPDDRDSGEKDKEERND